jgi:hypothetical protein
VRRTINYPAARNSLITLAAWIATFTATVYGIPPDDPEVLLAIGVLVASFGTLLGWLAYLLSLEVIDAVFPPVRRTVPSCNERSVPRHCSCGRWGDPRRQLDVCQTIDEHFPGCPDCAGSGWIKASAA